jgi:hypothetical protein
VPSSSTAGERDNTTSRTGESPSTGVTGAPPSSSQASPTEPQAKPDPASEEPQNSTGEPPSNSGTTNETITPSNPSTTTPNGNELPTGAFFQRNFANE